jgi:hypothetical protein
MRPSSATARVNGSPVEAALEYRARGMWVTPTDGKAPILDNWPNLRLEEDGIRRSFGPDHNVGVILGASGLADLDFDDQVAVEAYRALAPPDLAGTAEFEHAGRPHLIVRSQGVQTRKFKRADGSMLLELRGNGAQTVFPPSLHPDGLPYVWMNDGKPCEVEAERLRVISAMIATVAYAAESWSVGSRHDLALALAGFLARRLDEPEVLSLIRAVATVATDAEMPDREAAVETTVRRLQAGQSVAGLPTLDSLAPELARALASWWGTDVDTRDEKHAQGQGKASQADLLVELGRTAELFHDPSGTGFARLHLGSHLEIWPLQSKRFRNWLRLWHYQQFGKAPNSDAINATCGVLDGIACFDGTERDLHNRVAWLDGAIYYDLADQRWRAIRVHEDGWEIVERPPIVFRRYAHQRPQVEPIAGGDTRAVLRFLNIHPDDQLLLLVWLVAAFVPDIPHPVPDFHGEKGSGKSVGQRVLRRVIDPSCVESLAFPSDMRELVQQLSHHYAPVYDNVDHLPPWVTDILCRAVTAEGFSKRELYSDDEDVIYSYRRVIMLNGINVVAERADLLNRSTLIALSRISRTERREEREFWQRFDQAHPYILGGVLDTLSAAMRVYPTLQVPSLERMADFTRWGAAIAEALGYGAGEFLRAYRSNIGVQTLEAVQGHIVGATVLSLMEGHDEWSGTPTELLTALEDAGEDAHLFRRRSNGKVDAKGWPGAPHILSRRLNEIRSNLTELGIQIVGGRGNERVMTIRKVAAEGGQKSVTDVGSVGLNLPEPTCPDATDAADAGSADFRADEWEKVIE